MTKNKTTEVQKFERRIKVDDVLLLNGEPILVERIVTQAGFTEQRVGTVICSRIRPDGTVIDHRNSVELKPQFGVQTGDVAISDMEAARQLAFLDVGKITRIVELPAMPVGVHFTRALEIDKSEEGVEKHPSYGVVRVSRPSGQKSLFGSELQHQHYMTLSIHRAERKRSLGRDWISGDSAPLVEIAMSEVQWARMVSSAGMGEGVSCTLEYILGHQQDRVPDQNRIKLLQGETGRAAKAATDRMTQLVEQLEALIEQKSVTKTQLKEALNAAKHTAMNIGPNLDFAVKSAQEAVENVVETGKAEIEAFIDHQARKIGMKNIQDMPRLVADREEKVVEGALLENFSSPKKED